MSDQDARQGLDAFRIAGLPPDFYYIPNFLSAEEEASILHKIPAHRWAHLTHRRLQAHPSTLTATNTLLASPLPPYLTDPIIPRFAQLGIFAATPHQAPNHVLVNEYAPGAGIMPHEDGAAYAPVVATVSLGGAVCLDISEKASADAQRESNPEYALPTRIFLERGSLLITRGAAYSEVMHGIAGVEADEGLGKGTVANWGLMGDRRGVEEGGGRSVRGRRVSLTYRDVVRVSAAARRVLGGVGRK